MSLFGTGLLAQRVLDDDELMPKKDEEEETLRFKNPFLAMALSAAVPGAGQFYVDKTNLLAFAFAGAEALSWYLHFSWDSDGDDKVDEYERYAWTGSLKEGEPITVENTDILSDEGHWSWLRWRDAYRGNVEHEDCFVSTSGNNVATDSMLVEFWFTNRHEFYEDIGKYDKYDCGWTSPEFRGIYQDMRIEANNLFDRARRMSQVILLNHVVAGVHAFFQAKSHNKRVEAQSRSELKWDIRPDYTGAPFAQLVFNHRF